jgi:thiol-disulfide isomerase/thioredoxin
MQIIIRIFVIICFIASTEAFAAESIKGQMIEHTPRPMPDSPLYDLNNKEFFLESLEGNVIILHFWASWCTQCALEMQKLNSLQKMMRKDPIIVVPVSEDFRNIDKMKEFYKENHLRYLLSFIDKDQKWFRALSLNSLPTTFILNGHMEHIATVNGVFEWTNEETIARIKSFILRKEALNPDYIDLLSTQDNLKKEPVIEAQKPKPKEIPKEAITDVVPLDKNEVPKDNENINVTNAD